MTHETVYVFTGSNKSARPIFPDLTDESGQEIELGREYVTDEAMAHVDGYQGYRAPLDALNGAADAPWDITHVVIRELWGDGDEDGVVARTHCRNIAAVRIDDVLRQFATEHSNRDLSALPAHRAAITAAGEVALATASGDGRINDGPMSNHGLCRYAKARAELNERLHAMIQQRISESA
ncbi:MAG: hypothetical protein ACLFS5_01760 [Spirochaetaceae bacterium]